MEATLALAMITQRFELMASDHVARPKVTSMLAPADGVHLRVRRRRAIRRTKGFGPRASDSSISMSL